MAAARTPARRRMGACETTPPATHREPAHDPDKPTATGTPSSPPMIFRRLPPSSSFVLAAARLRALQLDPWPRGEKTRHLRGRIQKNSQPSPAARLVTGPGPYALLTLVALMGGCRDEVRRDHRVSGRQEPATRTTLPTMPHGTASRTLARLHIGPDAITVRGRVDVAMHASSRRYACPGGRQYRPPVGRENG